MAMFCYKMYAYVVVYILCFSWNSKNHFPNHSQKKLSALNEDGLKHLFTF